MIVVKVGGSLYDHPGLGPGLRAYLAELAPEPVLLVPGGGPFGNAVRHLDAVHRLGEDAAHRIALKALAAPAAFLRHLVGDAAAVLDCDAFATADPELPHSWAVTTDSIAARAAVVYRAARLVLLKSIDLPPGTSWPAAAARGWVDDHFPHVVAGREILIEAVNFRSRLG